MNDHTLINQKDTSFYGPCWLSRISTASCLPYCQSFFNIDVSPRQIVEQQEISLDLPVHPCLSNADIITKHAFLSLLTTSAQIVSVYICCGNRCSLVSTWHDDVMTTETVMVTQVMMMIEVVMIVMEERVMQQPVAIGVLPSRVCLYHCVLYFCAYYMTMVMLVIVVIVVIVVQDCPKCYSGTL